jgi:hypothetical protein
MKKLIIVLLLFFNATYAQKMPVNKFSISVDGNYPIAFGNNFLTKAYKNEPGFDIEVQYSFKKFFFGTGFQKSYVKICDTQWIGDFDKSDGFYIYSFGGYRQKLKPQKLYLEHKIGIGYKEIINQSDIGNYSISGYSLLLGSKINYCLNSQFNIFSGLDFNYSYYDVILTGPFKDFYSNSYQITPTIGVKYLFGKK